MAEAPRRRASDRDRRRWSDERLDDFRAETNRRLDDAESRLTRYWTEMQGIRSDLAGLRDDCDNDRRETRTSLDQVLLRLGAPVAAAEKGSNWREFFVYLVGTVAVLGVTIAGIVLAVPK